MSDTNGFQFFVMIGGPFWCVLLLCFLCQWAYKVFKRWRERKWRRTHPLPKIEKWGSGPLTGTCFLPPQAAMSSIILAEVHKAKLKIERGESIFTVPGLPCYGCPELKDFFHEVRGCVTCPFKMAQELEELREFKAKKEKEEQK